MDILVKVNSQSNGRDKLARLIQYTSRLIWHQLECKNANKYSIDRIRNLESNLSAFRKVLRLGRCIDIFYSALDSLQLEDPWLRYSLTVSKIATALYFYSDHIVWLSKSGFIKSDATKWNNTANRFWLLSIIANLVRDMYELVHILELNKSVFLRPTQLVSGPETNLDFGLSFKQMYLIVNCHKDVFIDTFKNSCDLFIPLTALGFTKMTPSTIGVLGAVSSLAALVTMFKPIIKLVPA